MWPESVILPSPTIGQNLRLWGCGNQSSVEELIPEPAIERFRESVLPRGSWRDVRRAGGGASCSVSAGCSAANEV